MQSNVAPEHDAAHFLGVVAAPVHDRKRRHPVRKAEDSRSAVRLMAATFLARESSPWPSSSSSSSSPGDRGAADRRGRRRSRRDRSARARRPAARWRFSARVSSSSASSPSTRSTASRHAVVARQRMRRILGPALDRELQDVDAVARREVELQAVRALQELDRHAEEFRLGERQVVLAGSPSRRRDVGNATSSVGCKRDRM